MPPVRSPDSQDYAAVNEELKKLFPDRPGYSFIYNGFAEYGHNVELKAITPLADGVTYHLAGKVEDMSGGEGQGDFDISQDYTVRKGTLAYKKTGEKIMDTFAEMELLRTPLVKDTQWEQNVKDKNGQAYQLVCTITDVQDEQGGKVYTVLYKDKNSDFYEKRKFQENIGVISFEKLWKSGQESIEMGYQLYPEASGYMEQLTLKSYLPPLDTKMRFVGLAEYAHQGTLTKISENGQEELYRFNGDFQDGSGIPGQFTIQYVFNYPTGTVVEKVIENTRTKKKEVNSKLHDPEILRLPLKVGNTWQQEINFEGQRKLMTAQIVSNSYEGRTFYSQMQNGSPVMTVRYSVEGAAGYYNNTYIEERRFQQGRGMVGFSQLMKGDLGLKGKEDTYSVDEAILNHMFGYGLNRE